MYALCLFHRYIIWCSSRRLALESTARGAIFSTKIFISTVNVFLHDQSPLDGQPVNTRTPVPPFWKYLKFAHQKVILPIWFYDPNLAFRIELLITDAATSKPKKQSQIEFYCQGLIKIGFTAEKSNQKCAEARLLQYLRDHRVLKN